MNNIVVDRNSFAMMLKNESLIEHESSLRRFVYPEENHKGKSLYFGTGLGSTKWVTAGLPFDVLSMVLEAEKVRRYLHLSHVFHHIADTHALENLPEHGGAILRRAREFEEIMHLVIKKFRLEHFTVVRSSSFDSSFDYQDNLGVIRHRASQTDNHYLWRELADISWYKNHRDMSIKLGWVKPIPGIDERWFDDTFISLFGEDTSFIYTIAGRKLDDNAFVAPYVAVDEESRILLRPGEKVEEKFYHVAKSDAVKGLLRYFNSICRLYGEIVQPLDKGTPLQKVQKIIDYIFT